jgi:hypothetical protein
LAKQAGIALYLVEPWICSLGIGGVKGILIEREQSYAIVSVMINEFQKSSSIDCGNSRSAIPFKKHTQ